MQFSIIVTLLTMVHFSSGSKVFAGSFNTTVHEIADATSLLRGGHISAGVQDRSLQSGELPIEALVTEEDSVTVRLRQTLFGDASKCGEDAVDPDDIALFLFAIYKQPVDGGELDCEFFFKEDACWTEDLEIGCDPLTSLATIDLYIRDFKLSGLDDQVQNPHVMYDNDPSRICIGPHATVGKTVKQTATFECALDENMSYRML
jgi:hypothetical protein